MSTLINVKVKERSGAFFTNKVNGQQTSCTYSAQVAVERLGEKLFPNQLVVVNQVDKENWTIATAELAEPAAAQPQQIDWKAIEEELKKSWFMPYKFRLDGKELLIQKVNFGENRQVLAVYIDGVINFKLGYSKEEVFEPIITKVWRKRTRRLYSPKKVAELVKNVGKRYAQKHFPNLNKSVTFYDPTFTTASSLVRQLKKQVGIELVADVEALKEAV